MVGDDLIRQGLHDKVIFANSGWGGRKIEELTIGPIFVFLILNYVMASNKYGKLDHHRDIDNRADGVLIYHGHFSELLNNLDSRSVKLLDFSRAIFCGDSYSVNIELASFRDRIISDYGVVYAGPNTDLLVTAKERVSDNCHFSLAGNRVFVKMLPEAICYNHSLPGQ